MAVTEIPKQISGFNCGLVEITGNEPLRQNATAELIHRLIQAGYEVLLETNGSTSVSDTGGHPF